MINDNISADKSIKKQSFRINAGDLNKKIREKGYLMARAIPYNDLELNERKNVAFRCVRENNIPFTETISEVFKINCVNCLYASEFDVLIEYYEI